MEIIVRCHDLILSFCLALWRLCPVLSKTCLPAFLRNYVMPFRDTLPNLAV